MFEKASRLKLRFETKKGLITTEDLWDVKLSSSKGVSLDDIAKNINRELKENSEESFVVKKNKTNETLELKLNILKYIIGVKLDDQTEKENVLIKKEKKEKILRVLKRKEDDELNGKTSEELKKMLEEI